MTKLLKTPSYWLGVAILASLLCTGCSALSTQSSMTKDEEKNFKGGPMTPEQQKGFAEWQKQQKHGPSASAPTH